jgi:hypothetical protein
LFKHRRGTLAENAGMDSQLPEGFRLLMIIFAGALLGCELIQFVLGLDTDQFIDDFFVLAVALYALVAGML